MASSTDAVNSESDSIARTMLVRNRPSANGRSLAVIVNSNCTVRIAFVGELKLP